MEITVANALHDYFVDLWRIFDIYIPFLGMKISQFAIGFFVVMVGIKIYKTVFKDGKE